MKKIKLTKGKYALVDNEDFDLVNSYNWYYKPSGKTNGKNGYAMRTCKKESIFMHNFLLGKKKGFVIDHINRNGLDNRRKNIRLVTISQNYHNFPKHGSNKYRGVQFKPKLKLNPWETVLKFNKKVVFNKVFKTAELAAKAYNEQAIKYYGKCAQLNKIKL